MWQRFVIVIGRIFEGDIFIIGALDKILNWSDSLAQLDAVFSDWKAYVTNIGFLEGAFNVLAPMSSVILVIAVALELVGGISVVIGFKPQFGAFCLILFMIPTTVLVHHYWYLDGQTRLLELIAFTKNISILGGLFVLWASTSLVNKLRAHT